MMVRIKEAVSTAAPWVTCEPSAFSRPKEIYETP